MKQIRINFVYSCTALSGYVFECPLRILRILTLPTFHLRVKNRSCLCVLLCPFFHRGKHYITGLYFLNTNGEIV